MKKQLLTFSAALFVSCGFAQTVNFAYSGDLDSLQIPNCVDSIVINIWGAQGENALLGGTGGKGAYATGRMDVNAGDWIYINVGGQTGYNGGGMGGKNGYTGTGTDPNYGGWGGGASDIRVGGNQLSDRVIVAGGGGGGGHDGVWTGCQPASPAGSGGEGSGIDGFTGTSFACGCNGGGGIGGFTATVSAGGMGGTYNAGFCGSGASSENGGAGILGMGGPGSINFWNGTGGGGGGGGGYYGGGAGASGWDTTPGGGGGGGSSYTGGVANGSVIGGIRNGNGQVTITYILSSPIMTTSVGQSDITLTAIQSGVTYQWLNCGTGYSAVAGATNQSYVATANGSYAVKLNNGNGCIDTSACYVITQVGISENENSIVKLFPNPATDEVQVTLDKNYTNINLQIFDAEGKIVLESSHSNSTFTIDVSTLQTGVYIVNIAADDVFISPMQLIKL